MSSKGYKEEAGSSSIDEAGNTAPDYETLLAENLLKLDTTGDEEVSQEPSRISIVPDVQKEKIKKPTLRERVAQKEADAVAEEARKQLKVVSEIPEAPEPTSFENAMTAVENVGEGDFKTLDQLAKDYSGERLMVRVPVKGVGWSARPRKEGEGPLTVEQSQKLSDTFNAKLEEVRPKTAPAPETPEAVLRRLEEIITNIDSSEELEELAKDCKNDGLLFGGKTERGFWVKPIKGSVNSKKLVEAIDKRKAELARSERLERQLNEIEGITDDVELEKLAFTLNKLGILKKENIGARGWKVGAIDGVNDSQTIVDAITNRKKEILTLKRQLRAIEETKDGQDLDNLAWDLAKYHYLVKNGRGRNFTVEAGRKYGGKKLAHAVMKKKEEFISRTMTATLGEIAAKFEKNN